MPGRYPVLEIVLWTPSLTATWFILTPFLTASIAVHINLFNHNLCFSVTLDSITAGAESEHGLSCEFWFYPLRILVR